MQSIGLGDTIEVLWRTIVLILVKNVHSSRYITIFIIIIQLPKDINIITNQNDAGLPSLQLEVVGLTSL